MTAEPRPEQGSDGDGLGVGYDDPGAAFGPTEDVDAPGTSPTSGTRTVRQQTNRHPSASAWALPAMAVLVALVMTALDLNGSSLQYLSRRPTSDPSLVLGHPRGIRSDEFLLTTPQVIGNDRRGLPVQPWVGLTPTFLPATSLGVPSVHWTMLFKPRDWAFFVLPTSRAFAWYWWWPLLIGLVGVYTLLYLIGRRPLVAGALAAALAASPYSGWWSTGPAAVAGTFAAAAACVVLGMRTRRWWRAVVWGLLGGWFAVGGALILYPPWQIGTALLLVSVILGIALDDRVGWRRLLQVTVAAFSVIVPALAVWSRQSRAALEATTGTVYPGNRISTAGGTNLQRLLDAPSSLWTSAGYWVRHPLSVTLGERSVGGQPLINNSSEVSSTWLPLPLLVVAVVAAVWATTHHRRAARAVAPPGTDVDTVPALASGDVLRPRLFWTTLLVAAAELLLLAWAVVPLPQIVGTLTLLDRVPGYRLQLALGLGTVLLLACASGAVSGLRAPRWLPLLVAAGAVLSAAAMVWGTEELHWTGGQRPGLVGVGAVSGVVSLGFALLLAGRRLVAGFGALILAASTLAVFVQINPLTHGLGVLERDPLVTALKPYVGDGRTRAAVYGGPALSAVVSSTGLQNLSGMTVYPDAGLWRRLAPGQEQVWNNYAKYQWTADPALQQPVIESLLGTQRRLRINPCAASTRALGITVSVSTTPLTGSCLTLDRTVQRDGSDVYVYRATNG